METRPLLSLHDFVIEIYEAKNLMLSIGERYNSIYHYAKFLEQKLTIDMFEGENKIFENGTYNDIQPSTNYNYYTIHGMRIFQDNTTFNSIYVTNGSIGLKISDLTKLNIEYLITLFDNSGYCNKCGNHADNVTNTVMASLGILKKPYKKYCDLCGNQFEWMSSEVFDENNNVIENKISCGCQYSYEESNKNI